MAFRVAEYFEPQGGVFGKVLALWGLAFKANTDDMRESPALSIIEELTSRGMRIRAYDPLPAPTPVSCWRITLWFSSRTINTPSAKVPTPCS